MKAFEFGFELRTWQMILHLSDKRAFDCIEHCTRLFHFVNLFESFEYVFKKFIQSKLYASSFRRFVMHLYHPINVCMFCFGFVFGWERFCSYQSVLFIGDLNYELCVFLEIKQKQLKNGYVMLLTHRMRYERK